MKKILILFLFAIIFILLLFTINESTKFKALQISSVNENMQLYIERENKKILEHNEVINYDYDVFLYNNIISYVYKFNTIHDKIIKCYNFNIKTNKICYIDVHNYKIQLTRQFYELVINPTVDIEYIEYSIQEKYVIFYVSKKVTNNKLVEIKLNIDKDLIKEKELKEKNNSMNIALTFDDGPSNKTIKLVNLLREYNIKATFFVLGKNALKYKEELIYIYNNNHEIGNHTYNHYDLRKLKVIEIIQEIEKTKQIIYQITYYYPKIIRIPYGAFTQTTLNVINDTIIQWDCDTIDWIKNDYYNNIKNNLHKGSIILLHDSNKLDIKEVEILIIKLLDKGYTFTTISQLLELGNNYQPKIYFSKNVFINT